MQHEPEYALLTAEVQLLMRISESSFALKENNKLAPCGALCLLVRFALRMFDAMGAPLSVSSPPGNWFPPVKRNVETVVRPLLLHTFAICGEWASNIGHSLLAITMQVFDDIVVRQKDLQRSILLTSFVTPTVIWVLLLRSEAGWVDSSITILLVAVHRRLLIRGTEGS